ncbi:hypothetical protein [Vagococcus fluvialis]|uniref:hypothetical protein n=1 Tax=Vagococcus fluvialis TaxID=2738 RepID=UPI0020346A5F|nr:hypothetical protein [Vagococcus fluvialis]MCM2139852.1 hypothetical protein [Vagococcus fluvialis]URZ88911.1 vagococcin T immunity protein vcnI [Vagococcus fluvialis]
MKKINYKNPVVAGYLFLGIIFFIISLQKNFIFLPLALWLIITGVKENNKL